ncbi:hypothetical protein P167DRAFT_570597 [Morchella conica CCBAS932]|uniref:Uncharacterized protein n=1 Tax=Morchella conica CCBAS932 TaxID=1392247 RepID=A0A3N4L0L1_9PEZI|nr:hypothetical protein P167DRAFT_570597 [Morchella conica CCBAS932]
MPINLGAEIKELISHLPTETTGITEYKVAGNTKTVLLSRDGMSKKMVIGLRRIYEYASQRPAIGIAALVMTHDP